MNALDGLFSRQVPTRTSGGVSNSVADATEGNAFGAKDSFASALSGEYRKQRHGSGSEDQPELKGAPATPDDAASQPAPDDEAQPVLAEVFDFHFGARSPVEPDPDKSENLDGESDKTTRSFETTGYFESDLTVFAEVKPSAVIPPLADPTVAVEVLQDSDIEVDGLNADASEDADELTGPKIEVTKNVAASAASINIAGKTEIETNASRAPGVSSDPRSAPLPGRQPTLEADVVPTRGTVPEPTSAPMRGAKAEATLVPTRGEENSNRAILVDHGVRAKPTAEIRKDGNAAPSGSIPVDPDIDTQEMRIDQGRERTTAAKAGRSAQDAPMDNVRVIERRTIAAPQTSHNGEAVAKAIIQDVAQFAQAARSETARPAAAAPLPGSTNAQAIIQASAPKTLHTLNIQLNPHSLGQVTAVLKMTGDELSVELKVQTAEAYRQLKEDSTAIVKALRAQGYGVETISVQHLPGDRQAMAAQQGQQPNASGQQFQFQDGDARSASDNQSAASRQQSRGGRGGNNSGDGSNGHQSPSTDGVRRSDGVYL